MPPKAKGKYRRETVKPISGLDVDALLSEDTKRKSISKDNPVPEFKRLMNTSVEISDIEDAAKQMAVVVRTLITDSFGDSKYDRALECLGVLREEMINMEEPGQFNTLVKDIKSQLLSGALGGDRRDFWFQMRGARMGLIDNTQSEVSDVSPEQADEVSHCGRGCRRRD